MKLVLIGVYHLWFGLVAVLDLGYAWVLMYCVAFFFCFCGVYAASVLVGWSVVWFGFGVVLLLLGCLVCRI